MSSFDLPITSPDAHPEFTDSIACGEWLRSLQLINVGTSHGRLLGQAEELNCFELRPAERLKILEMLREPALFVQTETTQKFCNRGVPLSRPEREIFHNVNALWDALCHGYQHCLEAIAAGDQELNGQAGLACQRALWCIAQKLSACHDTYQETAAEDWKLLHRIFAFAEERGVAGDEVDHPAHKGKVKTTCVASYAQVLLLALANPNEQTPRQMALVARWLERWARNVSIARTPPPSAKGLPPLSVDLASGCGAVRGEAAGEAIRYLGVDSLSKSLRKRVSLLRKGELPAALGLGEDLSASMAESLLVLLYRQWCEERQSRAPPRRGASGTAQACAGMGAMHYYISGQPFRQPGDAKDLSTSQRDEIATFGRMSTRRDGEYSTTQGFAFETWQIKDESLAGLRLERIDPAATARLQLGQLLAVRPADAKSFVLGIVRWLSVSPSFELRAGIRTLPGIPVGIAIRPSGLNSNSEKYVAALMLPALPALQAPESLVIPAGWYKPRRVIDVYVRQPQHLLLTSVIERGTDFERVTFESA